MPPTLEPPEAPVETATPAPSPSPSPQTAGPMEAFDDAFKDLDTLPQAKPEPAPKPAAEPVKKPEPAKPTPEKPAAKVEPAKPQAKPEPEAKTEEESFEPPTVAKPNELRGWALRMGKSAKEAKSKLVELESKLAAAEAKATLQNGSAKPDSALAQQLVEAQKRIAQYEDDLRVTKYEKSQEYVDKWQKPITTAEAEAEYDIKQLLVEEKKTDPETGEVKVVGSRPGTWKDFKDIYFLDRGPAKRKAKELFGDDADDAMKHYDTIHKLYRDSMRDVEEYRTKGKERETVAEAQKKQEEQIKIEGYEKANAYFISKQPEIFDERPDDADGNDLLNKGRIFVDTFMGEDRDKYPLPQQLVADARIRNWAASFLRNQRDISKLKAELDEAKATIEQLRGSGPGKPAATETEPVKDEKRDWESEFDKAV